MQLTLDETRMRQLIINLISNAVKFTDVGSVTIRLSYSVPKRELTVAVLDTGIGIKDDDISRLFTKFSQVANTETRLFHGAGLGLNIVKQLVDLMGGHLGVQSEWQKGSQFWFSIPAEPSGGALPGEGDLSICQQSRKVCEAQQSNGACAPVAMLLI